MLAFCELAPVLTGMMVAGRSGSGMVTGRGDHARNEQIDALEMMAVSPIHYLVVLGVLAAMIMVPFCVPFLTAVVLLVPTSWGSREGVDPGIF